MRNLSPQMVLRKFRSGMDTVQISQALGIKESDADDLLHEALNGTVWSRGLNHHANRISAARLEKVT